MLKDRLQNTHFPYCLDRQPDGSYVFLNRSYKPIGFIVQEQVNYGDHPIGVRIKGITPQVAAELSFESSENLDRIYLYGKKDTPNSSPEQMQAYLGRLAKLMEMRIDP